MHRLNERKAMGVGRGRWEGCGRQAGRGLWAGIGMPGLVIVLVLVQ